MASGGKRPRAGRRKGSGKYGEPTKAVRIPVSLANRLPEILDGLQSMLKPSQPKTWIGEIYQPDHSTKRNLPLFMVPVAAGLPSPAEDYIEGKLDLNQHLIKHPTATFLVRATGDSMIDAGIHPGDILVVDRVIEPTDGRVVIAVIDGELIVKRLGKVKDQLFLIPENENYQPLQIREEMSFQIWGVVTSVIHAL